MTPTATLADLTDEWFFARNHIGGRWIFPAAPYDLDIRSPATSARLATIPLSSWRDVAAARDAATNALSAWADTDRRAAVMRRFTTSVEAHAPQLAALQSSETGLHPDDSVALTDGAVNVLRAMANAPPSPAAGVTGHVLASGAPVYETVTALGAALAAGHATVVKPSLRSPLTPTALARLFDAAHPPPGTLNLVHGAGTDVGAAMIADRGFGQVALRGRRGWTTVAAGQRTRLGRPVPWTFTGGSNALVVGRGFDEAAVAAAVRGGLRPNSAGGPLRLTRVVAHRDVYDDVRGVAVGAVRGLRCAPVSSSIERDRTLAAVASAVERGGRVLTTTELPDDRHHRMGWHVPPIVLALPCEQPWLLDIAGPILQLHGWEAADGIERITAPDTHPGITLTSGDVPPLPGPVAPCDDIDAMVRRGAVATGWLGSVSVTAAGPR